jgi:hypothetical protein
MAVLARMRWLKGVESHQPLAQPTDQDEPHVIVEGIRIPLLDGIGCGDYRVTLADGSETEVQLTECDLAHWGLMQGQSTVGAYMIDDDGVSWRFRRIDAPSNDVQPNDASTLASQLDRTAPQIDVAERTRELLEWAVPLSRTAISLAQSRWGEYRDRTQQRAASVVKTLNDGMAGWAQRLVGPLQRIAPRLRFSFGEPSDRRL